MKLNTLSCTSRVTQSAVLEWFALHIACAGRVGHVEMSARMSPILTGLWWPSASPGSS